MDIKNKMIELKREMMAHLHVFSRAWIEEAPQGHQIVEDTCRRVLCKVYLAVDESHRLKFPADWWQAFRARWFPEWWLEKHPILWRRLKARRIYLKIAPNPEDTVVKVHMDETEDPDDGSETAGVTDGEASPGKEEG